MRAGIIRHFEMTRREGTRLRNALRETGGDSLRRHAGETVRTT